MESHYLLNIFIAVALLAAIVLTVQEVTATSNVVSRNDYVPKCADLASRHSIHSKYISDMGVWMTYTEDGPTGVDGGLIQLLSDYRTCSR